MENRYPLWAIINFVLLSIFGLLLRYMQVSGLPGANYQFLLHAHSHFAFAGWMFFSISLLIIHSLFGNDFPSAHRKVLLLTQLSALGMLVSFSVYGYHPVSISFSTLFILVGYWFTYLVCSKGNLKKKLNPAARSLIYGGLIFLCLSSLGPFALGPIAAAGLKNTPLYQDAIYFYLHFQMNGFMLLATLGLVAASCFNRTDHRKIRVWLFAFIVSVVPLFFIFTLWADPPAWLWTLSLGATALNLVSWIKLSAHYWHERHQFSFLVRAALTAISVKVALQVVMCIPAVGTWVFQERNLVIGYVHLLTLGCIMPLILDQFIRKAFFAKSRLVSFVNGAFVLATGLYLSALFIQPLLSSVEVFIPYFQLSLLFITVLFPFAGIFYFYLLRRPRPVAPALSIQLEKCDEAFSDM